VQSVFSDITQGITEQKMKAGGVVGILLGAGLLVLWWGVSEDSGYLLFCGGLCWLAALPIMLNNGPGVRLRWPRLNH
jgi:hypothetical protein